MQKVIKIAWVFLRKEFGFDKGVYIIQDRTPEDCLLKGDDNHIRGYFFERFPKLKEQEIKRGHSSELVIETLKLVRLKK